LRLLSAILIAPLTFTPIAWIASSVREGRFVELTLGDAEAAIFLTLCVYFGLVVIGLPLYALLKRFRLFNVWSAALVGTVTAHSTPLIVAMFVIGGAAISNEVANLKEADVRTGTLLFDMQGAVIGVIFWAIAEGFLGRKKPGAY